MSLSTLYEQIKEFGYPLSVMDNTEKYCLDNNITAKVTKDINNKVINITFYQ